MLLSHSPAPMPASARGGDRPASDDTAVFPFDQKDDPPMTSPTTTTGAADLTAREWVRDPSDDYFGTPFVDVDEWRDAPVRHRYVHGGFAGTDTLFSFYFPAADAYEGRFFQHVTPVPQNENLGPLFVGPHNKIAFAIDGGGYFVETNGGGPDAANPFSGMDPTIGAFRASAAAARFSRVVAEELYGEHRTFGYLFGGSGGAYRTIGSSENTDGVWDGFAPYVPGSPMAVPNVFAVRMQAQRVLRDVFPAIVDAYDVGGDPSSLNLNAAEASAFEEVTRMGFPPRSWFGWKTMDMHGFSALYPGVMAADPSFADDFWTKEGYLGADPTSSVHRDRVRLDTTIAELIVLAPADEAAAGGVDGAFRSASAASVPSSLRLSATPDGWMLGAQLSMRSGAAAGAVIRLSGIDGDVVAIEPGQEKVVAALAAGDEVTLDNSNFLAAQTYHRHQVPGPEYTVWDQFRDADGAPLYPQRPMLLGPQFTRAAAGTVPTGDISGKMIVVAALLDREAFAWQADWLRQRVAEHLGDRADAQFRLWYVENAVHGDDDEQEFPTRTVSYLGVLEAALFQLAEWVEKGVEPAPTTTYRIDDGQVVVAASASERGGVQPVVALTVDGAAATTVRVGAPVAVRVEAEAPGEGVVVAIEADLTGAGEYGARLDVTPGRRVVADTETSFSAPGTYFVTVRVTSQVDGDANRARPRPENLARARVVVVA